MRSAEQTISYCENAPLPSWGPRDVIVQRPIIRRRHDLFAAAGGSQAAFAPPIGAT